MVALIRELKNEGKIKLGDPKSGFGRLGERATRLCVFFFFILSSYICIHVWVPVAMRFTAKTREGLKCKNLTPTYAKGWTDVRTVDFVRTNISWMHTANM